MKKLVLLVCLAGSICSRAQVPTYVPANSLVAFWPFSGNANDATGNGNNGTVVGAVLTNDRFGGGNGAYYFPNTAANCGDYYIQLNVNTAPVTASGAVTLSFWINRVANGCLGSRVMEWGSCTTCPGQILITWVNGSSTMNLRHYLTATDFVEYNYINLSSGNWYNIVYTNDGDSARYYLDGSLIQTILSPAPAQLSGNVAFGRMNHPDYDAFNGDLDDIGLWSRALSPCEVNALYTGNAAASFAYNSLQDTTYICDSTVLDAGAGYKSYSWNTGSGTETISANQNKEYKVTVTNGVGCMASDSTQVIILKPTITQKDTTVCSGSSIALSTTGIAGSSQTLILDTTETFIAPWSFSVKTVIGQSYSMSISGTASDHCVPGDVFNNADAAYFYDRIPLTEVDQATAPDRLYTLWNGAYIRPDGDTLATSHIYNYTLPAATQTSQPFSYADAGGPGAYGDNCGQMTFEIYQVNQSSATYTWSAKPAATAGLNAAAINKQSITVTPTATTTYYVTVNDGITSCEDSVTITIAAVDTSINVLSNPVICQGDSVQMQAGTANSYQWLFNGNPIPTAKNRNYTAYNAGTYGVAITNSSGCIDTSRMVSIIYYSQPVASFTINNNKQCLHGNLFDFTNRSTISNGALQYQWAFGDGVNDLTANPSHSYTLAQSFAVQLISTSNNGCKDSVTQTVIVNTSPSAPVMTAGGPVTFCENGNVVLTSNAPAPLGNQWYLNGTAINGATLQKYTAAIAGQYTVIAYTVNNCWSDTSNSISVTVNPIPPLPSITAAGPLGICADENVVLTSDALSGNQWYQNGVPVSGATSPTFTAASAGAYTVIVTADGCASGASAPATVVINPTTPTPVITANGPVSFCGNGTVVLMSGAATGNQWYNDGTLISGATGSTFTASSTGGYTDIATGANSCPSEPSTVIAVNVTQPVKNIRYPVVNTYINTPTELDARTFGDQYTWIPSAGLDDPNSSSPIFNYDQTQDYVIQITTNSGCVTYDSVLVIPYKVRYIVVPTAFSPNGDGLNDILHPFLIDTKQLNFFRIYNKWGQLIFESSDPARGWDGTYNGTAQPIGNYIWTGQVIDNNGAIINQHGQVVLIR